MAATTTATATDIQEVVVVAVAVDSTSSLSFSPRNWNHRKMTYETVLGSTNRRDVSVTYCLQSFHIMLFYYSSIYSKSCMESKSIHHVSLCRNFVDQRRFPCCGGFEFYDTSGWEREVATWNLELQSTEKMKTGMRARDKIHFLAEHKDF
jgi:hypothetical protein